MTLASVFSRGQRLTAVSASATNCSRKRNRGGRSRQKRSRVRGTVLDEKLDEREEREKERAVAELSEDEDAMEQRGSDEEVDVVARLHQKRQKMQKLLVLLGGEPRALSKACDGDENIVDTVLPVGEDADHVH